MFTNGSRGISNVPTVRKGRTRSIASPDSYDSRKCSRIIFSIFGFIFIIAGSIGLFYCNFSMVQTSDALAEIKLNGRKIDLSTGEPEAREGAGWRSMLGGNHSAATQPPTDSSKSAAYFVTRDIKATARDRDFNLAIPQALKMERRTEYCQWEQLFTDKCDTCQREGEDGKRESYNCNCRRDYWYIKSWKSHRIISLGFDQPAAHWNPQDDPYPSTAFFADDAVLGGMPASPALIHAIKGRARPIKFTYNGLREPRWYDFISSWFGYVDPSRIETLQPLLLVPSSRAALDHKFLYAGDGYFFRPYSASTMERLLKAFFQYQEGSLLDFQFADLVPSCEAGDIKVSYYIVDPEIVSGIGAVVVRGEQKGIDVYTTSRGYPYGVLYAGEYGMSALLEAESWRLLLITLGIRFLVGLPLAYILSLNILTFLGAPSFSSQTRGNFFYWAEELCYLAAIFGLVVYTTHYLALKARGFGSTDDATTALGIATVSLVIYLDGLVRATRRAAGSRAAAAMKESVGGFSALWRLYTEPAGVFIDGIYSASATAASQS